MQRLFSGMQPSGKLHIGNYFGALKQWIELSSDSDAFFMVADYHALTSLRRPAQLQENIYDLVADWVAAGLNPKKTVVFKQSDVSEHTELAWIFDCLVSVNFLMQAHAFKDKTAKGVDANAGLFTYPMLMAADILLYDTDIVPVGQDQRQHVEYAREAAAKFNLTFGPMFKEPQERVIESTGVVPGIDGKKMSKSYGNTIPLFATREEITIAVMNIVTDSSGDIPVNVRAIHGLFKTDKELMPLYEAHKGKYKILKEALIEDIDAYIAPMREVRTAISHSDVTRILAEGAQRAKESASTKMTAVRKAVGVTLV